LTFNNCHVKPKMVLILHAVHQNSDVLVPKFELMLAVKFLLTLPTLIVAFLAALWGFQMYKKARAGYLPPYLAELQQPLTANVVMQDNVYAVNYDPRPNQTAFVGRNAAPVV